jgi:uncharacterized OB-fold protein
MTRCAHCGGSHIPDRDDALSCINCGRPAVAVVGSHERAALRTPTWRNREKHDPGLTSSRRKSPGAIAEYHYDARPR